jgi:hypothetical protein
MLPVVHWRGQRVAEAPIQPSYYIPASLLVNNLAGVAMSATMHGPRGSGVRRRLAQQTPTALVQLMMLLVVTCFLLLPFGGASEPGPPLAHNQEFVGSDRRLDLGPYFFNPSVVEFEGQHLTTARTAYMKAIAGRWWWFNAGHICKGSDANFTSVKWLPWGLPPGAGESRIIPNDMCWNTVLT